MSDSLLVRDGNGFLKQLEVINGSNPDRIVPVHSLTGSISTSLNASDLSSLTSSMLAVSGAVGTFNQQLYQALSGGPVSMSVDIVAGDVNTITGSIDKVTTEIAKLTALSGSNGLRISGSVSASLTRGDSSTNPLFVSQSATVPVSGILTSSVDYATSAGVNVDSFTALTASAITFQSNNSKGYIIYNNTNHNLYLRILSNSTPVTTSSFSYIIDPFSVYESMPSVARLWHSIILHPSVSAGTVSRTNLS